jgi:hypothetical protein
VFDWDPEVPDDAATLGPRGSDARLG